MIRKHAHALRRVFSHRTWLRIAVSFALVIVPIFIFAELAEEVSQQDTLAFDESVLLAINSHQSALLDSVAVLVTQLGGVKGVAVIVAVGALLLWARAHRARAVFLILSVTGAGLLNMLLKTLFQRDRPQLWQRIVTENSFSFPSGHAMASSALAFSIMVIFWHTKYRWVVVAAASTYMVGIGLTRLYLGVHYPTDIIAGWIVSGIWVTAVTIAVNYRRIVMRVRQKTSS